MMKYNVIYPAYFQYMNPSKTQMKLCMYPLLIHGLMETQFFKNFDSTFHPQEYKTGYKSATYELINTKTYKV
jgi:hypothetical protein